MATSCVPPCAGAVRVAASRTPCVPFVLGGMTTLTVDSSIHRRAVPLYPHLPSFVSLIAPMYVCMCMRTFALTPARIPVWLPTASQADLEKADGCEGKYTVGLGQNKMAYVDDRYTMVACRWR